MVLIKIYGYCSPENKWYIGQTSRPLIIRSGKTGCHYMYEAKKFAEAIKKYGWSSMEQHVLRLCVNQEEADYYEAYYCDVYDSVNNGYNISRGRHTPGYHPTEDQRNIKSQIAKGLIPKVDGTYAKSCKDNPEWIAKLPSMTAAARAKSKPIAMLDKETKEVIKVFVSKSEAVRFLRPDLLPTQRRSMVSQIGRCLRGINETAYGYGWMLA